MSASADEPGDSSFRHRTVRIVSDESAIGRTKRLRR